MIKSLLQRYKKITIGNSLALAISLGVFVFSLAHWWNTPFAFVTAIIVTFLSLVLTLRTKYFLKLNSEDFLEHINRHFPEYQESAQLLVRQTQLTNLQALQKQKIEQLFKNDISKGRLNSLQPKPLVLLPLVLIIFSLINFSLSDELSKLYMNYLVAKLEQNKTKTTEELTTSLSEPSIVNHNIIIQPPSYTGKQPEQASQLDFEAIQNSTIKGLVEFSRPSLEYYYSRSGRPAAKMIKQGSRFNFSDIADRTSLYKFSYKIQDKLVELDGIYTISIVRDKAAKITITKPRTTLIEYPKSGNPQFTLRAEIKDDFGINDVRILASVAKGSGEAVKFRDKAFRFKSSEVTPNENALAGASGFFREASYQKTWRLSELQMEPGDEAYFSLQALDNRAPNNQLSKSTSIIVRWLDEDEIEMGLEGLQIKFIPEFFRSQRQIIIETEQLIADGKDFSRNKFEEISTDLGRSQSDLKQKYGQHLGDEFGEGQGAQLGLADGYHGGETMSSGEASAGLEHDDEHTQDQHDEQHFKEEHSHDHQEHEAGSETSEDLSGAQQLIDQFGHNHSSVEVAPLSRKDPKSWMKMAVNEMWQAELHLMMSEPAKALPYEYQAYKFLKLARQAERVYAKRLGFEPPPVSEERRLTGELKAILESDLSLVVTANSNQDIKLFSNNYHLLNQKQMMGNTQLNQQQQQNLSKLSQRLLSLSEERPALVKYAAIAEKLTIAKTLDLKNCSNCVFDLKAKLWQLIPVPLNRPMLEKNSTGASSEQKRRYLKIREDHHD